MTGTRASDAGRALRRLGLLLVGGFACVACVGVPQNTPLVTADLSMSIMELETLRQDNPDQVGIGLVLGERYRRLDEFDAAEAAFQRVLDTADGAAGLEAGAWSGLGLVAQSRDELDLAETRLLEALRIAESAGLNAEAREQRERLAVLERVRGDFLAACVWYEQAGVPVADVRLTLKVDCGAPQEILALSAAVWRAQASPTLEGLLDEALVARPLAEAAEAAAARGDIDPAELAPSLGDYSTLVLYSAGAAAAEAVARRVIALDPREDGLRLHLILPLILLGRSEEAMEAAEAVADDWGGPLYWDRDPRHPLNTQFDELREAGLHQPIMDEVIDRLDERAEELGPR